MTDLETEETIAEDIERTRRELDEAREVVRILANDLANVADVIEPVLKDHADRIRRARMATVDEIRQISTAVLQMRELLCATETAEALDQAERLVTICRDLATVREIGVLAAFVRAWSAERPLP